MFPANGVVTRCLASHPPGPCGSSSPVSSVISRHCDFLPAFAPHFVSFAWRYHGSTHLSLPPLLRAATSGLGLVTRYPRPGILRGDDRSSQVPGEPQFPFAHGLRPRPAEAPLTDCGTLAWPPLSARRRRRRETKLSRLNSMAFGLAAYVSRAGYPADRARLASRRWSSSPGRAFTRRAPLKGFQLTSCSFSSLSKLLGTSTFSSSTRISSVRRRPPASCNCCSTPTSYEPLRSLRQRGRG